MACLMSDERTKGFTLIEVIIVIVILGVLATLALPRIAGQMEVANLTEVLNQMGTARRLMQQCYDVAGTWDACNSGPEIGMLFVGTKFQVYSYGWDATTMQVSAYRVGDGRSLQAGPDSQRVVCMYINGVTQNVTFYTDPPSNEYEGVLKRTGKWGIQIPPGCGWPASPPAKAPMNTDT